MMSIDLSELRPLPRREAGAPLRRSTPCAGLFGWRKESLLPSRTDAEYAEARQRNYRAD